VRLPAADLATTLNHVANLVAEATGADKIDAFIYDPTRDSLVAVGTSTQPLSARQRQLGLDVLPCRTAGAWCTSSRPARCRVRACGAHFSSSTTADVTCGREERCVIGNSLKKIS